MNCIRWISTLLFVVFTLLPAARGQTTAQVKPVSPRDFVIMAWGTSPTDPEQLRGMKEAGLNVSGFCRPEELDRVKAAGLTCFVTDPRVNDYDWEKMPADAELRQRVTAATLGIKDHPAALGMFLRDEPSAAMMPGLGRVAALVKEALPNRLPYVNLFPTYANGQQLATADYETYVRRFLRDFHPAFLSWDNYSLINGEMLDRFYTNMEIIRRLALEAGIPFWNCILGNTTFFLMEPSDATLHLQVYSTLAYGGRGIQYFTYVTPDVGNYRLGALDPFGNRTPTWGMLRRVNLEIQALTPWLDRLTSTGVYQSDPVPEGSQPMSGSRWVEQVLVTTADKPVAARYLLGEFKGEDGSPYLMLVNRDLSHSISFSIKLKQPQMHIKRISPYTSQEEDFGGEMDWLAPGAGVLLKLR
ncbi:MAG: hypothetical protein ACLQVM_30445 [Terriglobia bacterium]